MKVQVKFPDGEVREVPSHIHIADKNEMLGHKFLKGDDQIFTAAEWVPDEDPLYVFHQTLEWPYWHARPRSAEDLLSRASKIDNLLDMSQEDAEALQRKTQESK